MHPSEMVRTLMVSRSCEAVIRPERSQKQVDMSPPCMCSHNFIPWEEKRFFWPVSTRRCVFIHFTKRGCAPARAGGRRSEMPRMCLRLNDETPQRSGTKSSAGEMIVYLSTALNSHLFFFFLFFYPEVIRLFFFGLSHHWREDEPFCSDPDTCACSYYASIMVLLHYSLRIDGHNGTGPSWTFCVHCSRIVKQRPFSHTNQANQGAVKEIY